MKLWQKIVLIMMMTLLASLALCGGITIYQMNRYSLEGTVGNYGKQLQAVSYTFEQFCNKDELLEMNEIVKNSYLQFQFQKCCGSGYALFQNNEELYNLTDYDFVNLDALKIDESMPESDPDYRIQRLGKKHILLMKNSLDTIDGYVIVLVRDISDIYEQVKGQALIFLLVYAGVSLIAVLFIFPIVHHTLKPLKSLKNAAVAISQGQLDKRVKVVSKDEVGIVSEAFNQMAEKVEAQVEELKEVSEKRKVLLGSLTHELKTPMTSIIGYSETLLRVKLDEEQKERALTHIYKECRRLEKLSGKMMNLLGLYENDTIQMKNQSVEVLFHRVEEIEKYHLKEKEIEFSWDCQMGDIYMDLELMESLLINLIDNGIKASDKGNRIYLRGYDNIIEVEDEGKGMPKEETEKVTEAFYMVDKSRTRKEGGIGLGLALCEQIAHLHQAVLEIDSELGKGTTVRVKFCEGKRGQA